MNRRHSIMVAGTAGLATGLLLGPISASFAGHTNAVLEAELNGRSEVATGATNRSIVGNPNGRGEAYVFGNDGDPATLYPFSTSVHRSRPDRVASGPIGHLA